MATLTPLLSGGPCGGVLAHRQVAGVVVGEGGHALAVGCLGPLITGGPACCWPRACLARVVMELLGHSQISLTLGTYSHVAPEVSRVAADRIGDDCGAELQREPQREFARGCSVATFLQVNGGGAGGTRTRDRGIMSPLL